MYEFTIRCISLNNFTLADSYSSVADLDQVTNERNEARKLHEDLRRLRLEKFMDGFSRITLKLKEMYQMIY